jgi:hypothetical protein
MEYLRRRARRLACWVRATGQVGAPGFRASNRTLARLRKVLACPGQGAGDVVWSLHMRSPQRRHGCARTLPCGSGLSGRPAVLRPLPVPTYGRRHAPGRLDRTDPTQTRQGFVRGSKWSFPSNHCCKAAPSRIGF